MKNNKSQLPMHFKMAEVILNEVKTGLKQKQNK